MVSLMLKMGLSSYFYVVQVYITRITHFLDINMIWVFDEVFDSSFVFIAFGFKYHVRTFIPSLDILTKYQYLSGIIILFPTVANADLMTPCIHLYTRSMLVFKTLFN